MALIDQLRQDPRLADATDDELLGLLAQHPQFQGLSDNALRYAALGTVGGASQEGDDEPDFVSGLSAGVDQLQAAGGGLVMLAGDALESEGLYDAGKANYQSNMAEAQENALGYGFTDLFSDPETSAWQWAAYTAGNVLPSLATAVAGGGIGGIAARGLAGMAAKRAATQAGQAIGSYVSSAGMETGAIMGKVEQADVALAHGSIAGALDALPVMRVLRKAGGQELANEAASEIASGTLSALRRTAKRGTTKAAGIGGATQMLAEASTEGLQGLIEQHAEYWVANNGESLLANLGEADWKQIVDSAAAGGVAGLGLGAPVGVIERGQARREVSRQNQLPPDFEQPADANPDPMVYQNSEVSQTEADQAWADYDLSPAMRERRAQQRKEEAIAVARQQVATDGGDALQQTQAAQQAEQLAEAVTQQEAPAQSPNLAAEVGNRIQIAMTLADDMVGLASGSTEGQARLRNMQGVLSRAEAAFDQNNLALAERLLGRAERIGASLNANLQRSGSRERPAEGQLVEGDEGREPGIAGLIGQDGRRLPPGSGAIYAGGPTADTTQYDAQARNVRRDEGMAAQRQGTQRLRDGMATAPAQLTDQGIVYGEGPVPRRGNANTGLDQPFTDARFSETEAGQSRETQQVEMQRQAQRVAELARTRGPVETAYLPDNTPVQTRYRVVDLAELTPSNAPDGRVNPGYPQELQPRDRSNANSQVQVRNIAANLNPDRLGRSNDAATGAPIIGPDGVVESGNGRTMALTQAYQRGNAQAYRQYVTQQADAMGMDPAAVAAMSQPVLVRERVTNMDRADFARRAIESTVAGMTSYEQARADADSLSANDIQQWNPDQSGDPLAASNRAFQRMFVSRLGNNEAARYTTRDGQASPELGQRMQRAVFAKAYADSDMVEMATEQGEAMRNLTTALQAGAADLAIARETGSQDALTAIGTINDAVRLVRRSRQQGVSVRELVGQTDAFSEPVPPLTADLAVQLNNNMRSSRALSEALRYIGQAVRQRAEGEANGALFEDTTTNRDVFNAAFNRQDQAQRTQQRAPTGDVSGRAGQGESGAAEGRQADAADGAERTEAVDAPWMMTRDEWDRAREDARPNTAQSRFTGSSRSQAVAGIEQTERLLYGVIDTARQQLMAAASGEITLSPEQVARLQDRIDTPVRHRDVIEKALREGVSVPNRVLSDYPDLQQDDEPLLQSYDEQELAEREQASQQGNTSLTDDEVYDRENANLSSGQRDEGRVREPISQFDLFATPALPREPARATKKQRAETQSATRDQLGDTLRVRYVMTDGNESVPVGIDTINSPSDVAHIVAPFRKSAQENMLALVTDDDGKVLQLIRHSLGGKAEARIFVDELVASSAMVPRASKIWLSHNHPSGNADPSRADYRITDRIERALDASGIDFQGHVIAAAGGGFSYFQNEYSGSSPITPTLANRNRSMNIGVKTLRRRDAVSREKITNPESMIDVIEDFQTENGLLLLDNQHRPIGVLSMTHGEMLELRKGGRARRILEALGSSNAAAVAVVAETQAVAGNLVRFINNLNQGGDGVSVLDAVTGESGSRKSMANAGTLPSDREFYSLGDGASTAPPLSVEAVRGALQSMSEQLGDFTVIDSARELPENLILGMALQGVNPRDVKGVYEGDTLYIIAGNNDSIEQAMRTAVHEAVGHKGMRGVLGDSVEPVMRQLYKTLPLSKPGREALNEVLETYTFLDRNNPDDQLTIAEEMVAHLLEKGYRPKAWQRAVAAIRALLRRLFPGVAWTYTDVLALGEQSRSWLQKRQADQRDNGEQLYSLAAKARTPFEAQFTDFTDTDRAAAAKIGVRTPKQRAVDWYRERTHRGRLKIRQGIFDRNAALLELDQAAANDKDVVQNSTASSSWVLARMANAANGALHALLHNGRVFLDPKEKVIDVRDDDSKGLGVALGRLGSAAEIERFMGWIAGNRSAKLADEGRENLFEPGEVAAMKNWNRGTTDSGQGRAALYDEVFAEFQQYRDDVLAIAEQSGIISPDQRAMWRDEFYVPFYRVSEQDKAFEGPIATSGLSRQQAFKKLKGGTENLNDLLQNTMMNFHHLLEASLKNQAATQAMDNAMAVGIAEVVPESNRDTTNSTFVMRDGQKVYYQVDDPLVFKAITSLASPGMNSTAMQTMRWFKRLFTNLTTITPQFMVANFIRDSLQAPATSDVSKNVFANMLTGGQSLNDARTRAKLAASGATFNFGHLFGNNPDELRAQLTRNMRDADIVSGPSGIPNAVRKLWAGWGDVNNYVENINRAAIYQEGIDSGRGKLLSAFEARDLIDFSAHGAWPAVRILIDVVPFLNARLQGLDKIYRAGVKPGANVLLEAFDQGKAGVSDKQASGRFWAVTGAVAMASAALYLHNYDDEEYKKLEDWQKDTYWFLHVGDSGIFIPKPFEVGAISTLVERMLEQVVNDKATGKLFAQRLTHMLTDTFAFSPVPQAVQPMLNVYSNVDDFTNRPIESMGMDRLSPELRRRSSTTAAAQGISSTLNATIGAIGDSELNPFALSPVQVDHLIQGYFGQVGGYVAGMTDVAWKTIQGKESPTSRWYEYQPMRRFYQNLDDEDRYTRYGTIFYDALRESQRAYSDVKKLREMNELEEAREVADSKREMLRLRPALNRAQADLRKINNQMDLIRRSKVDGELKRQRMDRLRAVKNQIQKALGQQVLDARAG